MHISNKVDQHSNKAIPGSVQYVHYSSEEGVARRFDQARDLRANPCILLGEVRKKQKVLLFFVSLSNDGCVAKSRDQGRRPAAALAFVLGGWTRANTSYW